MCTVATLQISQTGCSPPQGIPFKTSSEIKRHFPCNLVKISSLSSAPPSRPAVLPTMKVKQQNYSPLIEKMSVENVII